jgi:hypothetical protein
MLETERCEGYTHTAGTDGPGYGIVALTTTLYVPTEAGSNDLEMSNCTSLYVTIKPTSQMQTHMKAQIPTSMTALVNFYWSYKQAERCGTLHTF